MLLETVFSPRRQINYKWMIYIYKQCWQVLYGNHKPKKQNQYWRHWCDLSDMLGRFPATLAGISWTSTFHRSRMLPTAVPLGQVGALGVCCVKADGGFPESLDDRFVQDAWDGANQAWPQAGGWTRRPLEVLSSPTFLCFYGSVN